MGFPRSASLLACALLGANCPSGQAEPVQEHQRREAEAETESLAASSQNPIADLISVPFQNNTTFGIDRPGLFDLSNGGLEDNFNLDTEQLDRFRESLDPKQLRRIRDLRNDIRNYENDTLNVLNIQPVVPFKLSNDLTLVTRTIVPVVSKPTFRRGQIWGIGDINPTFFFGKVVLLEPSSNPIRFNEVISGRTAPPGNQMYARHTSASGLAAVWARENTREAIWDAMARKEVFVTTGTRMRVRVFAAHGYARGVPMGGDLRKAPAGKAPELLVVALRDPDGANLDRVQIVKGWLDASGKPQEKVFDVVWSGDRRPGPDGKVPAVGNTVNVQQATSSNAIGAPLLSGFWRDPAFDPKQRAFYYVRVLEIPTPRWTTCDAKFFGVALPKDVPTSIQERAYTSPIWYTPA